MAFSYVQEKSGATASTGTWTITPTAATTAGNLVVFGLRINATMTVSSVTDSAGNAYVLGSSVTNSQKYQCIYGVQTASATTITITLTGGTIGGWYFFSEFSGAADTNAGVIDVESSATGTTITPSATISPSASGKLIVGFASVFNSATWTVGSGYTMVGSNSRGRIEYKLSGTTSETVSFTATTSQAWGAFAKSFNIYSPPASTFKPIIMHYS